MLSALKLLSTAFFRASMPFGVNDPANMNKLRVSMDFESKRHNYKTYFIICKK